ncbi:ATP-binding protein [Schlegelella aquatica]|uniref:ATP-binding protein n=1 Tax=Caldimonas aquatica TaxID=376175 RepID=UPI0037521BB6
MPQGGELIFSARPCERLPAALHQELSESLGAPPRHENYVAVSISDTGTGMPEAVRKRAFEPFFTTKEAGRGTGLGLSTVYGFVKQSKGGVTIDSTPGDGTTVTLYLPRVPTAPQAPAPRGTATHIPPGLKVLAVEDEPEVLRVVQAFLAGWGCEVTPARNAEQALGLLQAQGASFDLLLTDLVLGPGMPGTHLAARARQLHPGLAVVLMSGYASDLLASASQGEPQQPELLHKPFTREELAAAIAKAMGR